MITIIQAASWRRMKWKNGQGETAEIAVEPGPGTGFLWRFSIADVAQPGPFSRYPGVTRWITVLDGAGMRLTVGADAPRLMRTLDPPLRFDGAADTRCDLLDGPIRDINLMLDSTSMSGRMAVLTGPCTRGPSGEVILVHAVTPGVTVALPPAAPSLLAPTETAVIRAPGSHIVQAAGATSVLAEIGDASG